MQIQRIQSLFLLCAFAIMTVFIFVPFGFSIISVDGTENVMEAWYPKKSIGLWLPAALAALLSLIAIFLFNNLSLQKLIVRLSIILTLVTIGVTIYFLASGTYVTIPETVTASDMKWGGGGLLLLAGLIADCMALSRISADARLLRDMDRLR